MNHKMHHLWNKMIFIPLVVIEIARGAEEPCEEPETFMKILVRNRHQSEPQTDLQALFINTYE